MRDKIKQIITDMIDGKGLPDTCTRVGYSGYGLITCEEDAWASWQVTISSARWDKVTYRVYNSNYPETTKEQGVLYIGKTV